MRSIPSSICLLGMSDEAYPRQAKPSRSHRWELNPATVPGARMTAICSGGLSAPPALYISYVGQRRDNGVRPFILVSELLIMSSRIRAPGGDSGAGRFRHRLQAFSQVFSEEEALQHLSFGAPGIPRRPH
jgi:exonuclease V gamma subunit